MPRKSLALFTLLVLSLGAAGVAAERSFGEPMDPDLETIAIEKIVADPDDWVGKRVRIEGLVSGVCEKQGCWMDLVSETDASLRVKVDDGVIVFPSDAVGQRATAEGAVEILELDREAYAGWLEHQAEETGEDFDPASVGDGPYRVVRLRGTGATVTGP